MACQCDNVGACASNQLDQAIEIIQKVVPLMNDGRGKQEGRAKKSRESGAKTAQHAKSKQRMQGETERQKKDGRN